MGALFRTAVSLSRRQPYVDWANGVDDGGPRLTLESANRGAGVYLVAVPERELSRDEVVAEWWEDIFEEELAARAEAEDDWPSDLTRDLFESWFEVSIAHSVVDLAPEEPMTEDEVDEATLAAALGTCAWCGLVLDAEDGRVTGIEIRDPEMFGDRQGRVVAIPVEGDQVVMGIVPLEDSDATRAGHGLVFRICATRCEKILRKSVSRALRRLA
jgi:hypothetical protein